MRLTKRVWSLVVALIAVSSCRAADHEGRQFQVPPPDSYSVSTLQVRIDSSPEPLEVATVSREFFTAANVRPFIGRLFEDREYQKTAPPVVVLAHELWQRRMHGFPQVIGTALSVNGQPTTVVGVTEPGFAGPAGARVWMPRAD